MSNNIVRKRGISNMKILKTRNMISPGKGMRVVKEYVEVDDNVNDVIIPTISDKKSVIVGYLENNNIEYSLTMKKQDLIDLIEKK